MTEYKANYPVFAVFVQKELGFKGNPAAVVETQEPLSHEEMQRIAAELNKPATSFLVPVSPTEGVFSVRWFAPDGEIGLCGHGAAAATAYLGANYPGDSHYILRYDGGEIEAFYHYPDKITLVLDPIPVITEIPVPEAIREGLGIPVVAMYETGNKHLVLTDEEEAVKSMKPDFEVLRRSEIFGYAVTAPGGHVDFVSRTFVPHVRQLEDYATGSSHAVLAPFWAARLDKTRMVAHQLSSRGGEFVIELQGGKLKFTGQFERY